MKNYADRGGCCNTLLDLHNSSYHTKAEFNNCFIIHSIKLKTMNKKQEKNDQQVFENFIQGSELEQHTNEFLACTEYQFPPRTENCTALRLKFQQFFKSSVKP